MAFSHELKDVISRGVEVQEGSNEFEDEEMGDEYYDHDNDQNANQDNSSNYFVHAPISNIDDSTPVTFIIYDLETTW